MAVYECWSANPRHTPDPDTAVWLITAPGTVRQSSTQPGEPFINQVHLSTAAWILDTHCSMQHAACSGGQTLQPPARCCQCSVWCGPWPGAAQPAGPGKNVSSATKSGDFLPQLSFVSVDQGEYEQA